MQTESRFQSRDTYYGAQADARARAFYRDPIIEPGAHGRADVANGRMSKWLRFNSPANLVEITNWEGRTHVVTRTQLRIYRAIQRFADTGVRVTLRALADELGVAASSVYRAAVKLAAMGFLAYQSNRGRNGGSMFVLRRAKDHLEWAQDDARAKVRRWWKASEERISRLRRNVASMFPDRKHELYEHHYVHDVVERNIYREWSVEDFREAGLM